MIQIVRTGQGEEIICEHQREAGGGGGLIIRVLIAGRGKSAWSRGAAGLILNFLFCCVEWQRQSACMVVKKREREKEEEKESSCLSVCY